MPSSQPERADHYFARVPRSASRPRSVELILPEGRLLELATDSGVFSPERVDPGTRALLADGPVVPPGGVVADVGCGYGAIAITLALRGGPGTTVWAVDVNARARELCATNAIAHGVGDQVRVVAPPDVPADLMVDQVWSNPPIRVGKEALHELLTAWLGRLRTPAGTATIVVQKHLGADSLARWLGENRWPTTRLASRGGYRVLSIGVPNLQGQADGDSEAKGAGDSARSDGARDGDGDASGGPA